MSELCASEIRKAVRQAAESGEILYVAMVAGRIAALCGAPAREIASQLTEAAVKAGVTLQFGAPAN